MKTLLQTIALLLFFHNAKSQTVFQYDGNGNMVAVGYTGNRTCNPQNAPLPTTAVFTLLPQPAHSKISIEFQLVHDGNAVLEIANSFGQKVKTLNLGFCRNAERQPRSTIPLTGLPAGLYLATIRTEKETASKTFVKL